MTEFQFPVQTILTQATNFFWIVECEATSEQFVTAVEDCRFKLLNVALASGMKSVGSCMSGKHCVIP